MNYFWPLLNFWEKEIIFITLSTDPINESLGSYNPYFCPNPLWSFAISRHLLHFVWKKENFFLINLKLLHPGLSEPFDWNSILFKNHFFSKNASLWKQFSVFYPSPLRLEFRTLSYPRETNQKPDQEKIVEIFNPVIRRSVDPLIVIRFGNLCRRKTFLQTVPPDDIWPNDRSSKKIERTIFLPRQRGHAL